MKILLVSPFPDSGLTDMHEPPHGLAYIASVLRENGYVVEAVDAKQMRLKTSQAVSEIISKKPDIIGLTAMTPDIVWAGHIAQSAKAALPNIPILVGGPHVTALPEQTLREFPGFDVGVIGEGEFAVIELVQKIKTSNLSGDLEAVQGIVFRRGDNIIITEPRGVINELDSLPFPAWDIFPVPANQTYPVYATRGCPYCCKFCQRVLGNKVRNRSVENIIKEIEWLLNDFHITGFWFADETFGLNKTWTSQLLNQMIAHNIPERVRWHAQTRVDLMSEEILLYMKKAGCDGIGFGVESGNPEILAHTGKKINLELVLKAVNNAKKLGLKTRSFFILGHPFETLDTIRDTIDFAARLNTDFVSFAVMVPYPGTEVWEMARKGQAGYSYISQNWDDFRKHLTTPLGLTSISPETLRRLDKQAYLTFYYRNKRWRDLAAFLWEHRASVRAYIGQRLKNLLTAKTIISQTFLFICISLILGGYLFRSILM